MLLKKDTSNYYINENKKDVRIALVYEVHIQGGSVKKKQHHSHITIPT